MTSMAAPVTSRRATIPRSSRPGGRRFGPAPPFSCGQACCWSPTGGSPTAASRTSVGWETGLTSVGRLTGLLGVGPAAAPGAPDGAGAGVERAFGQDRLARGHRMVGFTSFNLMLAHVVLITLGYAAGRRHRGRRAPLGPDRRLPRHAAARVAGTACLVLVVVDQHPRGPAPAALRVVAPAAPVRLPRRRARPAAPAVDRGRLHRVAASAPSYWWTLWTRCGRRGPGLAGRRCRVAATLRHRLRVAAVVPEAPGVVSVYLTRARPRPAAGAGRPVLPVAVPGRPGLDAGAPVLPVGRARRRAACASPSRTSATAAPRSRRLRPGTRVLVGGPVRSAHRSGPDAAQGRADRCGRGDDADPSARRRTLPTPPARRCCCTGTGTSRSSRARSA